MGLAISLRITSECLDAREIFNYTNFISTYKLPDQTFKDCLDPSLDKVCIVPKRGSVSFEALKL